MTQKEQVLDYLEQHGSITPKIAESKFGIMRLASRISDLEKDGIIIIHSRIKGINRFGKRTIFAQYSLPAREIKNEEGA